MSKQKICVYAICKNEIKFIDKWLESMSEADYIVVLDTGSTDGTYEKLKEDPRVTLVEQKEIKPWRFDVARNKSMELIPADADILVCTDFDEVFEPGWAAFLREHWNIGQYDRCYYTYAWKHGDMGEPQFVFVYDKIHTREYKWFLPVHEVLMPLYEDRVERVLDAGEEIYLHHYPDNSKPRSYYFDLLKVAVEENPNMSHVQLLLGREYMLKEEYEPAIEELLKTLQVADIEQSNEGKTLLQTLHYLGLSYKAVKNYDEAIWYCHEFIRVNPTYREPYFLLAHIFNDMQMYTLAKSMVETGIKYSTFKKDWVESESSWYLEDKVLLAAICLNLKEYDEAYENSKAALEYKPNDVVLLKQYIACIEHRLIR